jgi:hypothetical protein
MEITGGTMTEQEWLACTDPTVIHAADPPTHLNRMLEFLYTSSRARYTKWCSREIRLFACACCRRYWRLLNRRSREAVLMAERFADGAPLLRTATFGRKLLVRRIRLASTPLVADNRCGGRSKDWAGGGRNGFSFRAGTEAARMDRFSEPISGSFLPESRQEYILRVLSSDRRRRRRNPP